MRVGDKKFQYERGSPKNPIFRGREFTKKPKNREDCLKRGLGKLANLIGGLAKKKDWCFERVIPQCTL